MNFRTLLLAVPLLWGGYAAAQATCGPLGVDAGVTAPACNGGNDGAIALQLSGGGGAYAVTWADGPVGTARTSLPAGAYTATVYFCGGDSSHTLTIPVDQPAELRATADLTQPSTGAADGAIDLSVTGGVGDYTFSWAGVAVPDAEDQQDLGPGEYTVTVSDANGCSLTDSFTLRDPADALRVATDVTDACPGADQTGAVDILVSGGVPPYQFRWEDGLTTDQNTRTALAVGRYDVTVSDADGNQVTVTVLIGTTPAITLDAVVTDSRIGGTGAIDLTADGGSGDGFSFAWSTGAVTEDVDGLSAGDYTVEVTDLSTGCSTSATYRVAPAASTLGASATLTPTQCAAESGGGCDGSLTLVVAGGIAPYTVTFTGGDDLGLPPSVRVLAADTLRYPGLCPGTFDYEVVDADGSRFSESGLAVTEPEPIRIAGAVLRPVTFAGGDDGGIALTVDGGTLPYTYVWSAGPSPMERDNEGLTVGQYVVTITDARGCTFRSVPYAIQQLRVRAATVVDVPCSSDPQGSVDLTLTGADGPFAYAWSNGDTTQDLTRVPAGEYGVTITDVPSGAYIEADYEVRAQSYLAASATVSSDFSGSAVTCPGAADGTALARAEGGVGEVMYRWSTDAASPSVSGLGAGTYSVAATDALGCRATASVTLADPEGIDVEIEAVAVRCAGEANGRLTAIAGGGVGDYRYAWSDGSTERRASGLAQGNYTLTVTDGNGCAATFNAGVQEPAPLTLDIATTPDGGPGNGTATVRAVGGTAPYTFTWPVVGASGPSLEGLAFGRYLVSVTDAAGCDAVTGEAVVRSDLFTCLNATDVLTPGLEDGLNDVLEIECINLYPGNRVEVFDRWGQSVFAAAEYDNAGTAFRGHTRSGELLPGGAYFYVLTYDDAEGVRQQLRGAITLLR